MRRHFLSPGWHQLPRGAVRLWIADENEDTKRFTSNSCVFNNRLGQTFLSRIACRAQALDNSRTVGTVACPLVIDIARFIFTASWSVLDWPGHFHF